MAENNARAERYYRTIDVDMAILPIVTIIVRVLACNELTFYRASS